MPLPLTAPAPAADDPIVDHDGDTNYASFANTQLILLRSRVQRAIAQGDDVMDLDDVDQRIVEIIRTLDREAKERIARVDALTQSLADASVDLDDVDQRIVEIIRTLDREGKERIARVDALTQSLADASVAMLATYQQLAAAEVRGGHMGVYLTACAKQELRERLGGEMCDIMDKAVAARAAKEGVLVPANPPNAVPGVWTNTYDRGSGHAVHGAPPRVILRPLPDGGTTIDVGIWRLDQGDQWRAVYEYCWVPCWHSSDARLVRDLLCEALGLPDAAAKLCSSTVDACVEARDQLAAGQADVELAYQHLLACDLDDADAHHIARAKAALARCLGARAGELTAAPMPGGEL